MIPVVCKEFNPKIGRIYAELDCILQCMHSTYHMCVTMHIRAGTGVLLGHSGFSLEKFDCRKVSGQQLTAS